MKREEEKMQAEMQKPTLYETYREEKRKQLKKALPLEREMKSAMLAGSMKRQQMREADIEMKRRLNLKTHMKYITYWWRLYTVSCM